MRAALAILLLPAAAAAEPCAHFDLFPGAGVDLDLVSALRARLERSGLASTGDLEDCPVRLTTVEEDVEVNVELEDRIVTRSFAREPVREAAWSISLLLEELAGVDPAPPEEIIPAVVMPVALPDLRPSPRIQQRVLLPPEPEANVRLSLGGRALAGVRYETQTAAAEWGALAFDAAFVVPSIPSWLRPSFSLAWYLPTRVGSVRFQSLQPAVGVSVEVLRYGRIALWVDPELVILRKHWIASTKLDASPRGPGAALRIRLEYRLARFFGVAAGGGATWLPQVQALDCNEVCEPNPEGTELVCSPVCDGSPEDLYTTPWDFSGVVEAMFHL